MTEFNLYRVYYYSAPQYNWDVRIDLYERRRCWNAALYESRATDPCEYNLRRHSASPLFHQSFPGDDIDVERREAALC